MNIHRKLLLATSLAAALSLAGCWDDDDPAADPVITTEVPDSAGASTASFISFVLGLSATDETSEPLTIRSTFTTAADETGEPTPL